MRPSKLLSTFLWLLISFLGRFKGEKFTIPILISRYRPFEISAMMTSIKLRGWVMISLEIPGGK
jgi:hypothetical protein